MTITAKIIRDSRTFDGKRLTTFELRYPRMVHAELMTHRKFSRNASSSRAIPIKRMIQDVIDDPAMPVYWGKNQAGMQAREALDGATKEYAVTQWLAARDQAVWHATNMMHANVHKQIVNRLLEPWMHISVVVTATDDGLANWFHLRDHEDAQPEIAELARKMWDAYVASRPRMLMPGQWHLPYLSDEEIAAADIAGTRGIGAFLAMSAARCARVSYLKHDGAAPSMDDDMELFVRLVGNSPKHASPTEHQATPIGGEKFSRDVGGNFGPEWVQHRKLIAEEAMLDINEIFARKSVSPSGPAYSRESFIGSLILKHFLDEMASKGIFPSMSGKKVA